MIYLIDLTMVEKTVATLREKHGLPGISVCLTDLNGENFITSAGVQTFNQDTLLDPSDHQRVGSITKIVTSTLILKLQEKGLLSLEQSVESILPGILKDGSRISVRQLLQHRSGLKDYIWMDIAGTKCIEHAVSSIQDLFPPQSLIRLIANQELEFEPGTEYKYSNTGYILLGMIVEKCSGEKFEDAVDQWIIQPLHLERTYFPSKNHIRLPFATGHSQATPDLSDISDEKSELTELNVSIMWTAGALISNPAEIQKIMKALFSNLLLSQVSLEQMLDFHETDIPNQFYGLGLYKYTFDNGMQAYGHHGGVHGYESLTLYYPDHEIFTTVIVNQMPVGVMSLAYQLYQEVFKKEL
jgi:D-alanyl-D-alanine carboxypeptidase